MKKILCLFFVLLIAFGLCACTKDSTDSGKLKIVAANFPAYDFAKAVAGDCAQVTMLLPPATETHGYEPTVSDIKEVSNCDIFIYTGGESDGWVQSIISSANNHDLTEITMMSFTNHICQSHDHQHEASHKTDEHIWTSPLNAISIVKGIEAQLSKEDSNNSESYKTNADIYIRKLYELDGEIRKITADAKRNTLVFADRFPLLYFTEEYGLSYYAAFSGCSEDTEASASTIAKLIDVVNEQNIPVVFVTELSNTTIAQRISGETGAKVATFYSCHKISQDDFESGKTYVDIMSRNIEVLESALN